MEETFLGTHKLNTMSLSEQAKKEVLKYIDEMDLKKRISYRERSG